MSIEVSSRESKWMAPMEDQGRNLASGTFLFERPLVRGDLVPLLIQRDRVFSAGSRFHRGVTIQRG